jgi:hypothetical protein
MTIPQGHRFEATQALRQVLTRAVGAKPDVHAVDAAWTLEERAVAQGENATTG